MDIDSTKLTVFFDLIKNLPTKKRTVAISKSINIIIIFIFNTSNSKFTTSEFLNSPNLNLLLQNNRKHNHNNSK